MEKKQNYTIPIIVMFLLFGMISFVTNLASPMGDILKNQFSIPNWQGTLGVFANFIAYAIMGYPAGALLQRRGYKKTALLAITVGFVGVGIQTLSGIFCSFGIYLLGAFIAGFSMCLLNTVVNPMLNRLGGGGNKGNQLIQFAGWVNANGDVVYSSSTKTFVMGTSDVELTAVFAYVEAFLDVTVNNDEMGYILINGERSNHYDGHVNDNVEITAVANEGYRFLMWIPSVGNNSSTLTYTLDNPICAINAVFAKNLDITDVADSYVIFSENGNIVIRGAEQQTIRVFDVVGRLIEQRNDSNTEEVIPMDNTGIYLIQVGDAPARRVVVRR